MDLHATLRQYWGYDTFRPRQEAVVRSLIGGHDVAVVMPTGGGKSLCYQLPAVVLGRTAIVVSPLISLMQDQAAQLEQMGIPAAVLNSSMLPAEQYRVIRAAKAGQYRLLYLSPERLARPDTETWLADVPLAFFVIDEAHCISEWGHEFRPEYRQMSRLRERFPAFPIAAFTASATKRVRSDIVQQLRLRDPHKHVLSFHRPNLRYLVRECKKGEQEKLLLAALQSAEGGSVIVYAPTIAIVDRTVAMLERRGIAALPYNGQMEAEDRRRNQEAWMTDEVRVLVGTVAFGLGINKPAVRAVIHLAMPKSIEQYYQEAGRAGRDGLAADCVLLWQRKDAGLLAHFIGEVEDQQEQQRGWQRYREVRGFVEDARCRHRRICLHFGETPKWETCGMCDVCLGQPEWLATAAVRPAAIPRPVTPPPVRMAVTPRPVAMPPANPELRERLREWRRAKAKEKSVPAYVVMHDTTLDDLCLKQPRNLVELLRVTGIGGKKAELYGAAILALIRL